MTCPMSTLQDRLQTSLGSAYQILRELGRGGMATVFLAHDVKHRRHVALKVLRGDYSEIVAAERFLHEIEIAARLTHPYIVPIFDSGSADGLLFYLMPYIEGETLRTRLKRERRLPVEDAIRVTSDVAAALAYAHAAGVVHRDIKPENVLMSGDHAIVADFGVARALHLAGRERMTQTGMAVGTPSYMSPEQIRGDDECDGRSDIYSLACMLYEMIAAAPPHSGRTLEALIAQRLAEPPPSLSTSCPAVPSALDRAVMRALARAPAERFSTVSEFERAVTASIRTVPAASAAGDAQPPSIAVLPFVNRSPDPDNEYFSDGLSEELLNVLARIPELRVASRTSSFAFKGRNEDVRRIGEQLGVRTVLEGSVRRLGNKLRIAAELVSTDNGYTVWSETYAREMEDVFAVQDEIANAITNTLTIKLVGRERGAPLASRATDSLEAYQLYLKGRFFWNKRTAEGMLHAIQVFEDAIRIDPMYAEAHAGLASAHVLAGHFEHGVSRPRDAMPKAKAAALRALELDATNAEAYAALGFVKYCYDFDWGGAERDLLRSIELQPRSPTPHHWLGMLLVTLRRNIEAIERLRHAQQLEPLSLPTTWGAAWVHHYSGEYEEAVRQCRTVVDMAPDFVKARLQLGQALSALGRHGEAIAELRHAASADVRSPRTLFALGYAYGADGRREESRGVLGELHAQAADESYVFPDYIASVHTGLGERDPALDWLERSYEERSSRMIVLAADPIFATLRGEPRFARLLDRLRLPA